LVGGCVAFLSFSGIINPYGLWLEVNKLLALDHMVVLKFEAAKTPEGKDLREFSHQE
jgi:hypothetical protein